MLIWAFRLPRGDPGGYACSCERILRFADLSA